MKTTLRCEETRQKSCWMIPEDEIFYWCGMSWITNWLNKSIDESLSRRHGGLCMLYQCQSWPNGERISTVHRIPHFPLNILKRESRKETKVIPVGHSFSDQRISFIWPLDGQCRTSWITYNCSASKGSSSLLPFLPDNPPLPRYLQANRSLSPDCHCRSGS